MNKRNTQLKVLKLLLDNPEMFESGMCGWVYRLHVKNKITKIELALFDELLEDSLPKRDVEEDWFSWEPGKIEPRLKWIEEQIKIIEDEFKGR